MDKIDKKLLCALDSDPRITTSKLAKKGRCSQQVADYRMKRFVERGIITQFGTFINLKALGYEAYRVFFTFHRKKEYTPKKIFAHLHEAEGVYWAARIGGKFDLVLSVCVKDFAGFDAFIDRLNAAFPGLIADYCCGYVVDYVLCRHKYFNLDDSFLRYGYDDALVSVDDIDLKILCALKENCRRSALDIASDVGVSYKTVINRVKVLEEKKVILGYRLFLSSQEHLPFLILVSYGTYSHGEEKKLLAYLRKASPVTQVTRLFGSWSLMLNVRSLGNEELQEFLIDLRDRFSVISGYEIVPVFTDVAIDLFPAG